VLFFSLLRSPVFFNPTFPWPFFSFLSEGSSYNVGLLKSLPPTSSVKRDVLPISFPPQIYKNFCPPLSVPSFELGVTFIRTFESPSLAEGTDPVSPS